MSDYAYPLANYNWDYKTYVDNNYEPSKLGVSDDITLSSLFTRPLTTAFRDFQKLIEPMLICG